MIRILRGPNGKSHHILLDQRLVEPGNAGRQGPNAAVVVQVNYVKTTGQNESRDYQNVMFHQGGRGCDGLMETDIGYSNRRLLVALRIRSDNRESYPQSYCSGWS
jgi:hypothetical protein